MPDLPDDATAEAERLTRLARRAVDEDEAAAYRSRRAALLGEHDYACRVREDDQGETLVCYPTEWVEDGRVQPERVDDTDDAVEVSLSGPGEAEDWDTVEEYNRSLARAVRETHGDVHGDTADAFADYMGNHVARRIDEATARQIEEFRSEYFPRNAWPSDEQREVVPESLRLVFEEADEPPPAGVE